jgi:hypothetical protein
MLYYDDDLLNIASFNVTSSVSNGFSLTCMYWNINEIINQ